MGHGPHYSTLVAILFRLLFVLSVYCLGVNVYCHRVTNQLKLINIIIIIIMISVHCDKWICACPTYAVMLHICFVTGTNLQIL
jgi:hypothetical protein